MLSPSTFLDAQVAPKPDDKRKVMVCGEFDKVPDDSFTFVVVTNFREFLDAAEAADRSTVICIKHDQAAFVEVVDRFHSLFDFTLAVLTGIPECDYSPEFEAAVGRFPQISYHLLFNEIVSSAALTELAEQEKPRSVYEKEMKQITRANGTIKRVRAFDAPHMRVDSDDDTHSEEN